MKGSSAAAGGFSLGPWTVDPALRRLERDGEVERLEPKVMEVLLVLAARAPEVVAREELQAAVWGTEHVSEDLPRRAVYALRKALGDDPRDPRYIETIPRAGYRLVTPVGAARAADPPAAAPATARSRPARSLRRIAPILVAGLLALAAVTLGLLRGASHRSPAELGSLAISPLTAQPGLEYEPAFAPDGSRVAYLSASGNETNATIDLHVQLVGTESSLRLTREPASFDHPIESPAWSPDGTALAYRRWRGAEGWAVYRVPALGGAEHEMVDLGPVEASGLAWSPDARRLAVGLPAGDGGSLAIHRIGIESGERVRLTDPPATIRGDVLPAWSPDGASIAFIRNVAPDESELHVVPAAGGPSRSLLPERHKLADVDWSPDGRRLIVAVHDGGRHRIWSVDVTTHAARAMPELGDDTRWVSVARRGDRLALGRARWDFRIRRYDLASGEGRPLPALSSTFYDEALDVSPDGARLAFVSTRSGSPEVWISDLEGRRAAPHGSPMQLTALGGAVVGHPRWSADGGAVVFHAGADRSDLWAAGADGGTPRRLTGPPGDHRVPSPSRDGRSIYFASSRTGDWQVWRMPAAGGPAARITRRGGYRARESPDGDWLYFTRWRSPGLWRLPVHGGAAGGREERVLGTELQAGDWGNWDVTAAGVYFVTRDREHGPRLALWSPELRAVVRRIPLAGDPVQPSLALTPGGDGAVLAELDRIVSDLVLVEGLEASGRSGGSAPELLVDR